MSTSTALRWYAVKTAHASLADAISAGKYDYVNSDITATRFQCVGDVIVDTEFTLFEPARCAVNGTENDAVIECLDDMDLRPGNVQELLAFGEMYPAIAPFYGIVALGSAWLDGDSEGLIPFLLRTGARRGLYLFIWDSGPWLTSDVFLAART